MNNHDGSTLTFWLLAAFLIILWIAGGASRADVAGQILVRLAAWAALIAFVVFGPGINWSRIKVPAVLLGAAIGLIAVQLLPLPPAIWSALPGRELLAQSATVTGQPQPWRPISISPSATVNALNAMIVPVATLALASQLVREQHWRIVGLLLALIVAGSLLGLLQFSGARFDHPLINDLAGGVSANFANRNHFALFVALGCLIAPVWALRGERVSRWRAIVGLGLLPLFLLIILATGSRAGVLLGVVAIIVGLVLSWNAVRREFAQLPRKVSLALVAAFFGALILAVTLSVTFDRAESITRALSLQAEEDLRARALPTVLGMVQAYFPVGSGFGTFDAAYRIVEPDHLLQPVYFNRAHNDWLELVLDGGILAAALLAVGAGWWLYASWKAWTGKAARDLPRLGSAAVLLIMLASIPDYPARTPMIMAILVLGALWLGGNTRPEQRPATAASGGQALP